MQRMTPKTTTKRCLRIDDRQVALSFLLQSGLPLNFFAVQNYGTAKNQAKPFIIIVWIELDFFACSSSHFFAAEDVSLFSVSIAVFNLHLLRKSPKTVQNCAITSTFQPCEHSTYFWPWSVWYKHYVCPFYTFPGNNCLPVNVVPVVAWVGAVFVKSVAQEQWWTLVLVLPAVAVVVVNPSHVVNNDYTCPHPALLLPNLAPVPL